VPTNSYITPKSAPNYQPEDPSSKMKFGIPKPVSLDGTLMVSTQVDAMERMLTELLDHQINLYWLLLLILVKLISSETLADRVRKLRSI
jgi:hypothetical protein